MKEHLPVELAYDVIEPVGGADESLSPIIFTHNMGGAKELWDNVSQSIADKTKRKCYRVDLREHGDTKWTGYFQMDMLVEDFKLFMETHNIQKAVLIGHSMGGWAAGRLAMQEPEKVELLIMEDMHISKYTKGPTESSLAYINLWRECVRKIPKDFNKEEGIKFAVDYLYEKLTPEYLQNFTLKEDFYKCKFPIKRLEDGSYDVKHNADALNDAGKGMEISSPPEGVYDGPVFIVYGNLSTIKVYQNEPTIREHLPYALLILFDGATHNLHLEFPQKFVEVVVKSILQQAGNPIGIC